MAKKEIRLDLLPGVYRVNKPRGFYGWLFGKLYKVTVFETLVDDRVKKWEISPPKGD